MKLLKYAVLLVFAFAFMVLNGCAAIEHRNLDVSAKMSDTIFLDAEKLSENKPVYVRVTNTSDFQDIDFNNLLRQKLAAKGRVLTMNPKEAAHAIQANVLYLGEEKKDMTAEGALAGGFGGAVSGVMLTASSRTSPNLLAGGLAGLAGAGIGAVAGSMVHVDTYLGVCDIQIKEKVEGGVTGLATSNLKQGNGTTVETKRNIETDKQEYRTRIAVKAVQTNIDRKIATATIAERLASQIAGLF